MNGIRIVKDTLKHYLFQQIETPTLLTEDKRFNAHCLMQQQCADQSRLDNQDDVIN